MKHFGSCEGDAEMQTNSLAWGIGAIALTIALVFGFAFGKGHSRGSRISEGPELAVDASGPASIPGTQPAPASTQMIMRLADAVQVLDGKVGELREAVARRRRTQDR